MKDKCSPPRVATSFIVHTRKAWELSVSPSIHPPVVKKVISQANAQKLLSKAFPGSEITQWDFNLLGAGFVLNISVTLPETPPDTDPEWLPVNRHRVLQAGLSKVMTYLASGIFFQATTEVKFAEYIYGDSFSTYSVEVRGHKRYD